MEGMYMTITPVKRKKMEKLVYDTMMNLDTTGENSEKYRLKFKGMNDKQFETYFQNIFNPNTNDHLVLDIVEYERDLKIENIEKAAKFLNVPLMEYVMMPFVNGDTDSPVVTQVRVPVGRCCSR